jgi:hypothetical protein
MGLLIIIGNVNYSNTHAKPSLIGMASKMFTLTYVARARDKQREFTKRQRFLLAQRRTGMTPDMHRKLAYFRNGYLQGLPATDSPVIVAHQISDVYMHA